MSTAVQITAIITLGVVAIVVAALISDGMKGQKK